MSIRLGDAAAAVTPVCSGADGDDVVIVPAPQALVPIGRKFAEGFTALGPSCWRWTPQPNQ